VKRSFAFVATLWEHEGSASWYFLSVPGDDADTIDAEHGGRRGFGSIRVSARIGASRWSTSIFPDKKRATYVLPVKRAIRDAEGLTAGSVVSVELDIID
jgi:hypothetical protein